MFPPTPEQEAIIEAVKNSSASIMVGALAGTGKTTTLKMLAPYCRRPTLALAFNKKNALDLEKVLPEDCVAKTLNSIGHSAISNSLAKRLIVDDKKIGKLITAYNRELPYQERLDEEQWTTALALVKKARNAGLIPTGFQQTPKALLADKEENWSDLATMNDLIMDDSSYVAARTCLTRSIKMALQGVIDYDDQIYISVLFSGLYPRFNDVLVDEYQDLSPLNYEQLRKLRASRYIVVGDQNQAIYAFRGASSAATAIARRLAPEWINLPLATTWRCPATAVRRQLHHVPNYRAADSAPEGEDLNFLKQRCPCGAMKEDCEKCNGSGMIRDGWSWDEVPKDGSIAVLCRNNAPLVSMAFALLSRKVGFQMLGRDFGKGLVRLLHKICGKENRPSSECVKMIREWSENEIALAVANEKDDKIDKITDQAESLYVVAEGCRDLRCIEDKITELFKEREGYSLATLSTGHRAKGLEWHTVIILDPWRLPSKWAKQAAERGNRVPLEQEMNLKYVMETRTKFRTIFASFEDFQ